MSQFCIYIPRINMMHTEKSVSYVFAKYGYGFVERVDFVPIHKKPGFGDNVHNIVKSAFVHFQPNYSSPVLDNIYKGVSYRIHVSHCEYWVCLPRHQKITNITNNNPNTQYQNIQNTQYQNIQNTQNNPNTQYNIMVRYLELLQKVSKLEKTLENLIINKQTYSLFPSPETFIRDFN